MSRRLIQDIPSTPHFPFLSGAFRMSRWDIPYFSSTLTVPDAAKNLRLASEIPGSEAINWRLDELYQRDLNWPRVQRSIVPYLRRQENPQFFNSLTIALVPFSTNSRRIPTGFDEAEDWAPPGLAEPDRFTKSMSVGPLSFGFWNDWEEPQDLGFQSGEMRWNTDQVVAVAIDGQHRLAALKAVADGTQPGLHDTRVPVIFLVFDERVGFESPQDRTVVELLRVLFIDLNKNAQTVNRARQILLDDRDPHAVCVRSAVGEQLCADLDEIRLHLPRLPLSVIDWHSEQAKFDEGPYLGTVLGIDWIVSQMLNTKPIGDFTDYRLVKTQLNRIQTQLGVDLQDAWTRVVELEEIRLRPFGYDDAELESISIAFSNVWSRPVCSLLTEFQPYADFLNLRGSDGSLSLDFQHWYRLYEQTNRGQSGGRETDDYRRFLSDVSNRTEQPLSEDYFLSRLRSHEEAKQGNLAFKVVFQRALVGGYLEYRKIAADAVAELEILEEDAPDFPDLEIDGILEDDYSDEDLGIEVETQASMPADQVSELGEHAANRAREYVDALNEVVTTWPSILAIDATYSHGDDGRQSYFWAGTLRKSDRGIDFTQGASARGSDLLFMLAAMLLYRSSRPQDSDHDFEAFWAWIFDSDRPALLHRFARAVKRFARDESSAAGRILATRDEEFDEDAALEEVYWRLAHIWGVGDAE